VSVYTNAGTSAKTSKGMGGNSWRFWPYPILFWVSSRISATLFSALQKKKSRPTYKNIKWRTQRLRKEPSCCPSQPSRHRHKQSTCKRNNLIII
jgi:hypothetical protein